jgi:hypothetical protein
MRTLFFWAVTPCGLADRNFRETYLSIFSSPEDGDSMFIRNVGIHLEVHMALQPTSANGSKRIAGRSDGSDVSVLVKR